MIEIKATAPDRTTTTEVSLEDYASVVQVERTVTEMGKTYPEHDISMRYT